MPALFVSGRLANRDRDSSFIVVLIGGRLVTPLGVRLHWRTRTPIRLLGLPRGTLNFKPRAQIRHREAREFYCGRRPDPDITVIMTP